MPLLQLLRSAKEPRTAPELLAEIQVMRANGADCKDLPPNESELRRCLRALRIDGKVTEKMRPGGESLWAPAFVRAKVVVEQMGLFQEMA